MEWKTFNLEELKEKYESGASLRQLGLEYRTSKLTIKRKLEKIGVEIISSSEKLKDPKFRKLSGKRYDVSESRILSLYNSGLYVNEISKELAIPQSVIDRILKNNGIEIREYGKEDASKSMHKLYEKVKPEYVDKENFEELYKTMSVSEIARKYNHAEEAIRSHFKRFGINRRKPQESTFLYNKKKGFRSRLEMVICSILDDFNIEHDRFIINGYEFDILADNILIEVNGNYVHSIPKRVKSDKSKIEYYNKYLSNKYRLEIIWEHEFRSYQSVFNRLNRIFKFKTEDIGINNINIKKISMNDADTLYSKYHYLGKTRMGYHIGAYIGDICIGVATFSSLTRIESAKRFGLNTNQISELTRFCINPKYKNKNLGTYLMSKFIKKFKSDNKNILKLVTFADQTVGHLGTLYKASNWIINGETKESYYYEKNGSKWHKKTIWDHSKKMRISEKEFAKLFCLNKIGTLKKYRFIYDLQK